MQRVRIGLTGLAFVFVLVLLATTLVPRPSAEAPLTENAIERQGKGPPLVSGNATADQPEDPLAELGVTPGNADHNRADPARQTAR
jgi:hypothetical protein